MVLAELLAGVQWINESRRPYGGGMHEEGRRGQKNKGLTRLVKPLSQGKEIRLLWFR
jgi:hypothetical protein